jgi:hypothetical protein
MIRTTRLCRCLILLLRDSTRQGVRLSPPQPMHQTLPQMMPPTGLIASPWARDIPVRLLGPRLLTGDPGLGIKRPG